MSQWDDNIVERPAAEYLISSDSLMAGTFRQPQYSEWQVIVAGCIYYPLKNQEPNWFHRKMQELVFGFKWSKR